MQTKHSQYPQNTPSKQTLKQPTNKVNNNKLKLSTNHSKHNLHQTIKVQTESTSKATHRINNTNNQQTLTTTSNQTQPTE